MGLGEDRKRLVEGLKGSYLKNPKVVEAMLKVPREEFIPPYQKDHAYLDQPLSIGYGQTISAPHMVAIMTELLDVKHGQHILEVGSGSGYQAAILAELVGNGKIYTVERIPELAQMAKENLEKTGYMNVEVIHSDGTIGYEKEAPYDRIIVTAAAPRVPKALVEQLKEGGILLIPVGNRMFQDLKMVKKKEGKISERSCGGCVFVPLVGEDGW